MQNLSMATDLAGAGIFTQIGDTGLTLNTAEVVSGVAGTALNGIDGYLSFPGDVELFKIYVTGGGTFSANVSYFDDINVTHDTELFLFDSDGFGVYANDDKGGPFDPGGALSSLPANNPLTPTKSGFYYLAISSYNNDPISSEGKIFPDTAAMIVGATGPGGNQPLTGFENIYSPAAFGAYRINLTGTEFIGATSVAEPFL